MQINEMFYSIQGEGPFAGRLVVFLRLWGCVAPYCDFCFGVKGGNHVPRVHTLHGKKRIDKVKIGDKILTFNNKQELVETLVYNTSNRIVNEWYELKMNNTKYYVTEDHPFFTKRGIIKCKNLLEGDVIYHSSPTEVLSYIKKQNNPMFNKNTVKAMVNTRIARYGKKPKKILFSREERKKRRSEYLKKNNPMFNKETIKKVISTRKIKYDNGEYDFTRTDEMKKRYSEAKMGDKNPMKNPETVHKNWLAHKRGKSGYEKQFEQLAINVGIDVKYIGNGSLPIGYKYPDFIIKDTKKIIEVYSGTYKYSNGFRNDNYFNKRRNHFAKYGYETEFFNMDKNIKENDIKLLSYAHNGITVESIKKINKNNKNESHIKPLNVFNLSCKPYNTYLLDYMWVHNCDSKYTWDPILKDKECHEMEILQIEEKLTELADGKTDIVVITGGEPCAQKDLKDLVEHLAPNWEIHLETSGKIEIPDLPGTYVICSPKQYNGKFVVDKSIKKADFYKFVISDEKELNTVLSFIDEEKISTKKAYLMPKGETREKQLQMMEFVANACIKYGFNFSARLHTLIWDIKRKV